MNTDGGGTPDADECPAVSRPQSNQGCPEVKEEVRKRLAFAAKVIQFATGIATIKKQSYTLLNEIANILDKYPGYKMTISGHTDNVGKPAKNLELSKSRAAAVKTYFVNKSIDPESIETEGYGDTQPKESNKTAKRPRRKPSR